MHHPRRRRTAECILAEIGVDMSVFPSAKELASWAGQCPRDHQSAGRRRSGRTRKGSKWLDWALEEAALGAVKHSIIVACWHMLTTGELYNDLGGDYLHRRDPAKTTRRLVAQLERLGHTVTLQEAA